MSSRSPPTPGSSSASWRSPTSTTSTGSRPRSPSTRRACRRTRARPSRTVTEIYDYLRLLFARAGIPHCPHCGQRRSSGRRVQQIVDHVLSLPAGTRAMLLAPVIRHRKGEHAQVFEAVRRAGFVRVRVDGEVLGIDDEIRINKNQWHDIDVVVDRIVIPARRRGARRHAPAHLRLRRAGAQVRRGHHALRRRRRGRRGHRGADLLRALRLPEPSAPAVLGGEIEPRNFSFNTPHGACPACTGLGFQMRARPRPRDPEPHSSRSTRAPSCPSSA